MAIVQGLMPIHREIKKMMLEQFTESILIASSNMECPKPPEVYPKKSFQPSTYKLGMIIKSWPMQPTRLAQFKDALQQTIDYMKEQTISIHCYFDVPEKLKWDLVQEIIHVEPCQELQKKECQLVTAAWFWDLKTSYSSQDIHLGAYWLVTAELLQALIAYDAPDARVQWILYKND